MDNVYFSINDPQTQIYTIIDVDQAGIQWLTDLAANIPGAGVDAILPIGFDYGKFCLASFRDFMQKTGYGDAVARADQLRDTKK